MVSQVDDFRLEKRALQRLELQVKFPEPLKHNVEAFQVLLLHVAKDDNIIQVNHTVREIQLTQGILHEKLKGHRCITQPKWHAGELVKPKVTHRESRVLLQLWSHLDLPEA